MLANKIWQEFSSRTEVMSALPINPFDLTSQDVLYFLTLSCKKLTKGIISTHQWKKRLLPSK